MVRAAVFASTAAVLLACPLPALAAPLRFDCDVPANHFSALTDAGSLAVSATVTPKELRSGTYLPMAGARLASAGDRQGVSLQFIAASANSKQLDIVLITHQGKARSSRSFGQIGIAEPIAFSLVLSANGKLTLVVNGRSTIVDAPPISAGEASVYCSTGQFKFADIEFSTK
jgi:hypothetical protein